MNEKALNCDTSSFLGYAYTQIKCSAHFTVSPGPYTIGLPPGQYPTEALVQPLSSLPRTIYSIARDENKGRKGRSQSLVLESNV